MAGQAPEPAKARADPRPRPRHTANDRFHRQYSSAVALGLIAAVAAHVAFLELSPELRAADGTEDPSYLRSVDVVPPVEVPPPPEEVVRPATPRVGDVDVPPDATIPMPDWEDHRAPPGPPPAAERDGDRPAFIPYDVPPRLRNGETVGRLLEREFPESLRRAGIGGRVELWIHVDVEGRVTDVQVRTSSGHPALDAAAARVAREMRFSPALNRDRRTAVWVSQDVTFSVR